MGYALGIDLGTTFTAAAVARDGRVEVTPLGNHAATIPSLVFLRDNDEVLIGDAAERRGLQEPWRLARAFKRRFGDSTPILLDRTPFSAERLMALVFRQILDEVTRRQGEPPSAICVAHPANWGPYKTELLHQAAQLGGLTDAQYITEPVAAALHYAATERVEVGDIIAVYDLGGGTFDAAVLRKAESGFETLGQPQGIERLGGVDFDEAVFAHVRNQIEAAVDELDPNDPAARASLARLRQECVAAKEALSSDSEAIIPVLLPNLQTQITITRAEFEAIIRPTLHETIHSLRSAISNAGVQPEQLKAVLLAGGSSRIPMIAQLVMDALDRPIASDNHPKHAVALGAARFAAGQSQPAAASAPVVPVVPAPPAAPSAPPPPPASEPTPTPVFTPVFTPPTVAISEPTVARGVPFTRTVAEEPPKRFSGRTMAIAAALVAAVAIGVYFVAAGGSDDPAAQSTTPVSVGPTTASTTPTTDVAASSTAPSTTVEQTTTSTIPITCGASGRCVGISSIVLDGETLVVDYLAEGFDPHVGTTSADHHVHFFYDTVGVDNGGVPGPGQWGLWDRDRGAGDLIFNLFTTTNFQSFGGAGATELCVAVADIQHTIEKDTAFCTPLGFTMPLG